MASFLFPATTASHGQGLRMRRTYGSVYTDIARASSDALDALCLYRDLILAKDTSTDSVGFAAFDAHVGDTCCQLRACMMLDLTRQHREWVTGSGKAAWLDIYIEKLRSVHCKARDMLAKLTFNRICPEKLGIGAEMDTSAGLLNHLGWSEPEIQGYPEALYPNPRHGTPTNCYEPTALFQMKNFLTSDRFDDGIVQSEKKTPTKTYMSPLLDGEDFGGAYDPTDTKMLVRFLVFSFVLSKYKIFSQVNRSVTGRLRPEAAICEGDSMVYDVWEKRNRDYEYSKAPKRISKEFAALQTWVSELSCAWLYHTAKSSSVSPSLGK